MGSEGKIFGPWTSEMAELLIKIWKTNKYKTTQSTATDASTAEGSFDHSFVCCYGWMIKCMLIQRTDAPISFKILFLVSAKGIAKIVILKKEQQS